MPRPFLFALGLVPLALALAAPPSRGQQSAPVPRPDAGERLYERSCMVCHGVEATGGGIAWGRHPVDGPPLRGLLADPDVDQEALIDFIEEGHGAMPGWGGIISRPNIRRILEYLETLDTPASEGPAAPAPPLVAPES